MQDRFRRYILDTWSGVRRVEYRMVPRRWATLPDDRRVSWSEINPNWRGELEEWLTATVRARAEHPQHFCQMCHRERWRAASRRVENRLWKLLEEQDEGATHATPFCYGPSKY
jgi:hypothetical protein